jgi:hypothetical protein
MNSKHAIVLVFACVAGMGCASRERSASETPAGKTRQPLVASQTQTTGATVPAEVTNPAPDPFDAEAYAPARTAAPAEPAQTTENKKDQVISNRVRQRLAAESSLSDVLMERVQITTQDGHVTIRGWVPTVADKVTIEQRAREAQGVIDVRNELTTSDRRCGLGGIRC